MKKRKLANIAMVVIIVTMVCGGVLAALHLRQQRESALGTAFEVGSIPDDAIVLSEKPENLCTITIVCDAILSNQQKLDPAKVPYVPADGVILKETAVEFTEGETVFDVLQRVCTVCDIQLEYSWTPLYDSYYIEGINHLYEFDCGNQSGWMFRVNGAYPNSGCSGYEVEHADAIVWRYTCEGLGTDIGAETQ